MKAIDLIRDYFATPGVLINIQGAVGALVRGRTWAEADDLIHQAVVELFESPDDVHAKTPHELRKWIRTNTERRHIDDIRKRRRRREVPLAGVPDPEDRHRHHRHDERLDVLQARIERLPAAHQELLRLKYHEDLSVDEIAVRLEITPAAVERRLGRIHRRLREELRPPSGN